MTPVPDSTSAAGATNTPESTRSAIGSGNDGSGVLRALQAQVWRNKIAKGFNVADMAVEFGLLTAEVSEAFLAWRRGLPDLGEELADVAIYTLGLAEMAGVDLGGEVARKVAINADRVYEPAGGGVMRRVSVDDDTIRTVAVALAAHDGYGWPVDDEGVLSAEVDYDLDRAVARPGYYLDRAWAVVRALREETSKHASGADFDLRERGNVAGQVRASGTADACCPRCTAKTGSCVRCGVRDAEAWELCGQCDRQVEAEAARGSAALREGQ